MREYDNSFYDAEDMASALSDGAEIEFEYNNKDYAIVHALSGEILVTEAYNENSEKRYATPTEAMEYEIEGKKLRDIIPDLKIFFRSL